MNSVSKFLITDFRPHKSWWWFAPCCSSQILKRVEQHPLLFSRTAENCKSLTISLSLSNRCGYQQQGGWEERRSFGSFSGACTSLDIVKLTPWNLLDNESGAWNISFCPGISLFSVSAREIFEFTLLHVILTLIYWIQFNLNGWLSQQSHYWLLANEKNLEHKAQTFFFGGR